VVRTADAAAQLVQLGQAEFLGAVDEDGVGVRVVDAGFDDRRAQQQVGALLVKSRITRSSSRSFIWPWPTTMRASGSSFSSFSRMFSMVSTSLCRKYTWPPRLSSRSTLRG
jgi:hypothetical protein